MVRHGVLYCYVLAVIVLLHVQAFAEDEAEKERPPSAVLLPEDTLLFASILDVPDTRARFARTIFGRMFEDPVLQPVFGDILKQFEDQTAPLRESVRLTTDDLLNLPQGELALALLPREEGEPTPVVLINAS